jgi:hypothetical protein
MKAIKRAKSSSITKNNLHADFIVEYADTSLFPEGFHKPEDGWEIVEDEVFEVELALNPSRLDQFKEEKRQLEEQRMASQAYLDSIEEAETRKQQEEYQEFLAWKKATME